MSLQRKKALQRKTTLTNKRNYRMRHNTPKRSKVNRAVKKVHDAWLSAWRTCWWCRRVRPLHVHHISKRSRGGDFNHLANAFVACDECNSGPLDKSDRATMARALAIKFRYDPENFNLDLWREIHGPSEQRPDAENVAEASWAICSAVMRKETQ